MSNKQSNEYSYYNNQFFGRWAWLYDFEKYFLFPLRKKAAKFLDVKSPSKILDVATGTGALAFELAKLGNDVIGIDLSPEMLSQAKKKLSPHLKLKFQVANGTKLPFNDESFDATTISWGIHDMPYEIGVKVLKEMKRVTKKNGKIMIIDYVNSKKNYPAKITQFLINLYETKNYKSFVTKGMETYISEAGLKITKETNYLGIWEFMLLEK